MEHMMDQAELVRQIDDALAAHNAMKRTLIFAINLNELDKSPAELGRDDHCAFGRWLLGHSIDAEMKTHKPYQVIKRLHAEFHQTAEQVARLATAGRRDEAFALLDGDYRKKSDTLSRALNKWRAEQGNQAIADAHIGAGARRG